MSAKAKPSPDVKSAKNRPDGVLDPGKALVPEVIRVNEVKVQRGFWPKVRQVAAKVPFIDDVLAVWWCARDPETPVAAKGMMLAALAYFILPTDAIPDVLAGIGFTDDAAVIAALLAVVGKNIKDRHRAAARRFLGED
ncbi:MAG TPA: YkvA family protein [Caulobacter sp.]|nr:YkvA family protein [Caulobacter sp.]